MLLHINVNKTSLNLCHYSIYNVHLSTNITRHCYNFTQVDTHWFTCSLQNRFYQQKWFEVILDHGTELCITVSHMLVSCPPFVQQPWQNIQPASSHFVPNQYLPEYNMSFHFLLTLLKRHAVFCLLYFLIFQNLLKECFYQLPAKERREYEHVTYNYLTF